MLKSIQITTIPLIAKNSNDKQAKGIKNAASTFLRIVNLY